MTTEEYFGRWLDVIDRDELFKVTKQIYALYKTKSCEPAYTDIFKSFNITPYDKLKIVSLGMDPYNQHGVSTGIAFANRKSVVKLSPSLEILKEAIIDFEIPHSLITFDPSLEEVSKQGVLLLNSALTVETNKTNSHTHIWRPFISSLLRNLSAYNPGLIYVLWGNVAKSFESFINKNNIVFKMPHPAYYARTNTKIPHSFFVELNNIVYHHFGTKIEWFKEEKF
jgi:uracil-DNA glycosylase